MTDTYFLIDESGWAAGRYDHSVFDDLIRDFAGLLLDCELSDRALKWSEIWSVEPVEGTTLADLLFRPGPGDRDARVLIAQLLDRIANWDDLAVIPEPPLSASSRGQQWEIAPTMALGALLASSGSLVSAIGLEAEGDFVVEAPSYPVRYSGSVCFVATHAALRGFWRRAIVATRADVSELISLSPVLFPRIKFSGSVLGDFGKFEGSYADLLPGVVRHLGALSDFAPEIWILRSQNHERAAEMASRAGVECSPESPKTRGNDSAMKARRFLFDGENIVCEWHTKLERHRNRIHFAVKGEIVYVGCFVDHLPT